MYPIASLEWSDATGWGRIAASNHFDASRRMKTAPQYRWCRTASIKLCIVGYWVTSLVMMVVNHRNWRREGTFWYLKELLRKLLSSYTRHLFYLQQGIYSFSAASLILASSQSRKTMFRTNHPGASTDQLFWKCFQRWHWNQYKGNLKMLIFWQGEVHLTPFNLWSVEGAGLGWGRGDVTDLTLSSCAFSARVFDKVRVQNKSSV